MITKNQTQIEQPDITFTIDLDDLTDGDLGFQPLVTAKAPETSDANKRVDWDKIKQAVAQTGWMEKSLGIYRTHNHDIKDITGFRLFVRERNAADYLQQKLAARNYGRILCPSPEKPQKAGKSGVFSAGSTLTMGGGTGADALTPSSEKNSCGNSLITNESLPALADFGNLKSLSSLKSKKKCIEIGFDSEWQTTDQYGKRAMISWQFATIHHGMLLEFLFFADGTSRLTLDFALGVILDYLGMESYLERNFRRYTYCDGFNSDNQPIIHITKDLDDARYNSVYVYKDRHFLNVKISDQPDRFIKRSRRDWAWFHSFLDFSAATPLNICLVCHSGFVDLSGLRWPDDKYVTKSLKSVQGGLISMRPISMLARSYLDANNRRVYPMRVTFSDTMCHAPAGKKSLKSLGETIGVEKIDVSDEAKAHMLQFLSDDPVKYFEYASNDSIVTLLYMSALYGYNRIPPATITSAGAKIMKEDIMNYLGVHNNKDYDAQYRGLQHIKKGLEVNPDPDAKTPFLSGSELEPLNADGHIVQDFASSAYHGGFNGCSEVGFFPVGPGCKYHHLFYDYDLKNAYPTSMCLVPDIDWSDPIRAEIRKQEMKLSDFAIAGSSFNPIMPFVGYCRILSAPDHVKFPPIPIVVEGNPIYPKTTKGLDGVYVAGPSVYLALRLGFKIECVRGYFLHTKILQEPDGKIHESRSLAHAIKPLVIDRAIAKKRYGKHSLEELINKTIANSGYGKVSQNVSRKRAWCALRGLMEDLGCSDLSNPVSAMMITSIVQCELIAALNQIPALGYHSVSVTTDGFISDCPPDVLKKLDLFGFRDVCVSARLFLSNGSDHEIWEPKHCMDDLLNFLTRGNVSLHDYDPQHPEQSKNPLFVDGQKMAGVCAHAGLHSPYTSDSYDDRLWLLSQVVSRTGPVKNNVELWSTFKDFITKDEDFHITTKVVKKSLNFDLKRKPVWDTLSTDIVTLPDGRCYEMAHFDTEPFDSVDEYLLYRRKAKSCQCLRTVEEWMVFKAKIDADGSGALIGNDPDWAILFSCIQGYRNGLWTIPALEDAGLSVDGKISWINRHNTSHKVFTKNDWKNSRRPERLSTMLPRAMLQEKLSELGCV